MHKRTIEKNIVAQRLPLYASGLNQLIKEQGGNLQVSVGSDAKENQLELSAKGLWKQQFGDQISLPSMPIAAMLRRLAQLRRKK